MNPMLEQHLSANRSVRIQIGIGPVTHQKLQSLHKHDEIILCSFPTALVVSEQQSV